VTLVLAYLPRQSLDDSFLRQDRIFLVLNALLDTLPMTTDLELEVITSLGLSFAQGIEALKLDELRLDRIKLEIQVL